MGLKIKKSFVVLFLSMILTTTSCSKESYIDENDGRDTEGGKIYIAFDITIPASPGALLRADGDAEGPTAAGMAAENAVKSLRVVLYAGADNTIRYVWDYAIGGDGSTLPSGGDILDAVSPTAFSLKAKEVERADYKVLVLVNPTDAVRAVTEEGDRLADLNAATADGVATAAKLTAAGSPSGFYMSNADGLIAVAAEELQQTAEAAEQRENRVIVNVERGVAKVGVRQGLAFEVKNGKGGLISWGLDVTNRSMYWMRRKADRVIAGVQSPETATTYLRNRYAEDPNFSGFSGDARKNAGDGATDDLHLHFKYAAPEDIDMPFSTAFTYDYCLENTMDAADQWQDVTTSVVIKARWIPEKSAFGAPIGETVPNSGVSKPYFVFRGFVFTADELDAITSGTIPASAFPSSVSDIKDVLEAVAEGAGPLAGTSFAALAPSVSVRDGELSYNIDGVNYYRVPLRHFNNETQPEAMAYGRFGVVRNNVYELTVGSIVGPGRVTIDPDPEIPDEWIAGFISVRLQILPWILRVYDQPIGEQVSEYEYYYEIEPTTAP